MVKFTGRNERAGTTVVGLGISEGNVKRLREGKPIHVDLRELKLSYPVEVLIFYGKTEADIERDLASVIGPDTVREEQTRQ